jgi:fibronectin type 3 domain-containing protein
MTKWTLLLILSSGCASTAVDPRKPMASLTSQQQGNTIQTPNTPSVTFLPPYVILSWNASPGPDVAGYNVYYGYSSHSYSVQIPVGTNLQTTLNGLELGRTYYFSVTAVDKFTVESDFSEELQATIPQILELHFDAPGTTLQSSTDMINWSNRPAVLVGDTWRVKMDTTLPMEFYRGVGDAVIP